MVFNWYQLRSSECQKIMLKLTLASVLHCIATSCYRIQRSQYSITDYPPPLSQRRRVAHIPHSTLATRGVKTPLSRHQIRCSSLISPCLTCYHCRQWSTSTTQLNLRETTVHKPLWPGSVALKSHWTHLFLNSGCRQNRGHHGRSLHVGVHSSML